LTGKNPKPTVIWRLSDGRSGHDAQSNGLVKSLGLLMPCDCYDIEAGAYKHKLVNLLRGNFPPGIKLSDPDLIIGAGHQTHVPMLCAQHARGGKTIVIMKPSMPYSWFDYCIIPEHDNPPERDNIIITRGAINSITPTDNHDARQGLMLIGGPSKHYQWDDHFLIEQLNSIIMHDSKIYWTISTSPRTPYSTLELLNEKNWPGTNLVPYEKNATTDLHKLFAKASFTWVSEDSVSMIYEALTAGASVGLLSVPIKKYGRIKNALEKLLNDKLVTDFKKWNQTGEMCSPMSNFNESDRCATLIQQSKLF